MCFYALLVCSLASYLTFMMHEKKLTAYCQELETNKFDQALDRAEK